MVNLALHGCIAQAGQASAGAGPTSVSIATGASGNYDNSFTMDEGGGQTGSSFTFDGSSANVTSVLSMEEGTQDGPYKTDWGNAPASTGDVFAYLRATGATSYSMQGSIASSSLGNGCSASWDGGAFTSQDGTGSGGIGHFHITHGGGRGGYFVPLDGNWVRIQVAGTATASGGGTTDATSVIIKINFTDL